MDLILWRHAQAEDVALDGTDMGRTLTKTGQKQAARMGAWLHRQLPRDAVIWASPARRTLQTALALNRRFTTHTSIAPEANVAKLLELAQWPHCKAAVLLVGHQPTLGQTVVQLLGMQVSELSVPKGSVWWLRYRERAGVGQTVVVAVQTAEML